MQIIRFFRHRTKYVCVRLIAKIKKGKGHFVICQAMIAINVVNKTKPIIYVQKESPWRGESRDLIEVLFEVRGNYVVFWYHWPKDDYIPFKEDYEPVILVIFNDRIVDIGIRPHNRYKHSSSFVREDGRPIIIFATAWHRAHIFDGEPILRQYTKSQSFKRITDYDVICGRPPNYYIKARSNQTVYEYAEELISLSS